MLILYYYCMPWDKEHVPAKFLLSYSQCRLLQHVQGCLISK